MRESQRVDERVQYIYNLEDWHRELAMVSTVSAQYGSVHTPRPPLYITLPKLILDDGPEP